MNNDCSFLRHEALNIITLIDFMVSDADMNKSKKEDILAHLKMVGLLVSQQDVLSGKKKEFSNHEIKLYELIELICLILEKDIKKRKIQLSISPTKMVFLGDSKVMKEGLEQILLKVMSLSRKIEIRADEPKKKIVIKYGSTKKIVMSKTGPIGYLREKKSYSEIFFRTAVYLMELNGIKTTFKNGSVEVKLPG